MQIIYALKNINGKPANGVLFPFKRGCWVFRSSAKAVLPYPSTRLDCIEYSVVVLRDLPGKMKVQIQDFYHKFKPAAAIAGGWLSAPMLTITPDDIFGTWVNASRAKIFQFKD